MSSRDISRQYKNACQKAQDFKGWVIRPALYNDPRIDGDEITADSAVIIADFVVIRNGVFVPQGFDRFSQVILNRADLDGKTGVYIPSGFGKDLKQAAVEMLTPLTTEKAFDEFNLFEDWKFLGWNLMEGKPKAPFYLGDKQVTLDIFEIADRAGRDDEPGLPPQKICAWALTVLKVNYNITPESICEVVALPLKQEPQQPTIQMAASHLTPPTQQG